MPPLDRRREAAIADFLRRLRPVLGGHLVDVRLFGSVARGDARPDLDIDILVVVQPDDERARLGRRAAPRPLKTITADRSDFLDRLLALLGDHNVCFCVIGQVVLAERLPVARMGRRT